MVTRKHFLLVAITFALIAVQIACSIGGYSLSKDNSSSQTGSESQTQTPDLGQPVPTLAAKPSKPEPTKFVTIKTPTSAPALQVAPPEPGTANAAGRVVWNSQPVVGDEVKLCEEMGMFSGCEGKQFSTATDDQGYYVFMNVTPGEYSVIVKSIDSEHWIFATAKFGISAKKQQLTAGETLILNDLHLFKSDLKHISPAEDEKVNEDKPTLAWDAYPDAAYYEVYLNPRAGSSISDTVTENSYTATRSLLNCEYTWQVEAFNADKIEIAEYDGFSHFRVVGQPNSCEVLLNSPQDSASLKGTGIELSWQAHPLATEYYVYVSDKNYKNVIDAAKTSATTYKLTEALPAGDYSWYIAAYDGSECIAWSDHYKLKVTGP